MGGAAPAPGLGRRHWLAALGATLAFALLWGATAGDGLPDLHDSKRFAWAAWHLVNDGVFSQAKWVGPVAPEIGREPGYPALLAAFYALLPGLEGVNPACLASAKGCGFAAWRPVLFMNGVLYSLTGLCVFAIAARLGGPLAAWFAGGHVWLNGEAAAWRNYVMSDVPAMLLVAAATLAAVWAWQRPAPWRWAVAGAAFALLSLTKAVFLWLLAPAIAAAAIAVIWRRDRRRGLAGLLAFAIAYGVPVGGWMARNAEVGGAFAISAGRTAVALATREVYNHMTPLQYGLAFLYWTRAFGDGVVRDNFPVSDWGAFRMTTGDSFYHRAQHGTRVEIRRLAEDKGISRIEAERLVVRRLLGEIAARPATHAATTLPVFWRGIWIDEFIVFSLPALIWLLFARARRDGAVLLALLPGLFSLLFYPLVSLNIPRYQMTAIPALAVAFGLAAAALTPWLRRKFSRRHVPDRGREALRRWRRSGRAR